MRKTETLSRFFVVILRIFLPIYNYMDNENKQFWDRVNSLIKSQGSKQETICKTCDINYQTFRGWIVHEKYPNALQCYKIAVSLNTSVEYLLTGKAPKIDNTQNIELLQKVIENLK